MVHVLYLYVRYDVHVYIHIYTCINIYIYMHAYIYIYACVHLISVRLPLHLSPRFAKMVMQLESTCMLLAVRLGPGAAHGIPRIRPAGPAFGACRSIFHLLHMYETYTHTFALIMCIQCKYVNICVY